MTDAEREALEWLDFEAHDAWAGKLDSCQHARTLKAMLSRPVMPDIGDQKVLQELVRVVKAGWEREDIRDLIGPTSVAAISIRALYAHLTKPKTKTSYRVLWTAHNDTGEYGPYDGVDEAARQAQNLLRKHPDCVVTITPHEVAA